MECTKIMATRFYPEAILFYEILIKIIWY